MRVTGGSLKGFQPPARFSEHVRPTTDMMREAIFNKLQHSIGIEDQNVLDLFAGSGIVSLECLSRGAASVVSVDKDGRNIRAMESLAQSKELENWELEKSDVFAFLRNDIRSFDIIFADPPYDLPGIQEIPELAISLLADGGLLVLEHRPGTVFGLKALETRKHGSSAITIFAKAN